MARFQRGSGWMDCGLESQELMAICLKKINGLHKVKLVDANFVWTEPHSKRIKVKISIRKEVFRYIAKNISKQYETFMLDRR